MSYNFGDWVVYDPGYKEVFEKLPLWRKVLVWAAVIVLPFVGSLADIAF